MLARSPKISRLEEAIPALRMDKGQKGSGLIRNQSAPRTRIMSSSGEHLSFPAKLTQCKTVIDKEGLNAQQLYFRS